MLKIPTISEVVNQRGTCNTIAKKEKKIEKSRTKSNDLQNTMQKILSNTNLTKTGNQQWHPGRISRSCSTSYIRQFVIRCLNRVRCKYAYIDTNNI